MITHDYIFVHTNQAEVHALLDNFFRWGGQGRRATLHLDTRGGQVYPSTSIPLETAGTATINPTIYLED